MNVYEAIGIGFVVLSSCFGVSVFVLAAYHGLRRAQITLTVGSTFEDAGVRDYLPGIGK